MMTIRRSAMSNINAYPWGTSTDCKRRQKAIPRNQRIRSECSMLVALQRRTRPQPFDYLPHQIEMTRLDRIGQALAKPARLHHVPAALRLWARTGFEAGNGAK